MADPVYAIFAKFVVRNPASDFTTVLQHVMPASDGRGDPATIKQWYDQWRLVWIELALP